jgi:hypothetical protein
MMNLPPIMIIGTGAQRDISGGREYDVEVVLIDKTFEGNRFPSLFQVQSEPGEESIGEILDRSSNDHFMMMGQVKAIYKEAKEIHLANGDVVHYNHLIIANGNRHTYIAHDSLDEIRHGVSALVDALRLRKMLLNGVISSGVAKGESSSNSRSSKSSKIELTNAVTKREKEEDELAESLFTKTMKRNLESMETISKERLATLLNQINADILYEVQL